ncbi:hypothetical protein ACR6C2_24420 [Streptomyces sp. INA 01156]
MAAHLSRLRRALADGPGRPRSSSLSGRPAAAVVRGIDAAGTVRPEGLRPPRSRCPSG